MVPEKRIAIPLSRTLRLAWVAGSLQSCPRKIHVIRNANLVPDRFEYPVKGGLQNALRDASGTRRVKGCPSKFEIGEGPPAEPRHEVFSLKFLQFCCAGPWEFRAEVFAEVFFALNVPAKQGRKLRGKLRGKLREKLRPELPPFKTETSPKTSLCRNPLLSLKQKQQKKAKR